MGRLIEIPDKEDVKDQNQKCTQIEWIRIQYSSEMFQLLTNASHFDFDSYHNKVSGGSMAYEN